MKSNHIRYKQVADQDNKRIQAQLEIAEEFEQALEANSLERIRNLLYEVVYLGKQA